MLGGLSRHPGALGRSWLLQLKADVFTVQGKQADAERELKIALVAARQIPTPAQRRNNVKQIEQTLSESRSTKPHPAGSQ